MATGEIGKTAIVEVDDGTSSAFVALVAVKSVKVDEQKLGDVKATHLGSTAEEHLPTIVDPSEITIVQNYTSAEFIRLLALKGISHNLRIMYKNGQKAAYPVFLASIKDDIDGIDELVMQESVWKVTGLVTLS